MFNRKIQQNNKEQLTLFKGRNQYEKVIKDMNEAPKDYNSIKSLVETQNNTLANMENINIKPKNNIQMKSHNKLKNKK